MRSLLIAFGLSVVAVATIATYPYVQIADEKILLTGGEIQFAASQTPNYAAKWPNTNLVCRFNGSSLPRGNTSRTVVAWIRITDASTWNKVLDYGNEAVSGNGVGWSFYVRPDSYGQPTLECPNTYSIYGFGTGTVMNGVWHLYGATYDSSTIRVWLDGTNILTKTGTPLNTSTNDGAGPYFGVLVDGTRRCDMAIDEYVISDRAWVSNDFLIFLATGRIDKTISPFNSNLVYAWTFDSCASNEASIGSNTAALGLPACITWTNGAR